MLEGNPEHRGKKTLPPDQLTLVYPDALVTLRGWRLELMLAPLVTGRVARVHTEKHLGPLVIEEAWVSEIRVMSVTPHPEAGPVETPVSIKRA